MLHYLELSCSNSFKAWFELLAETYWHGELKVVLDNFDTMEFEYPTNPETYDVICITGSDSAAFDDKDWCVGAEDESSRCLLVNIGFS
jgi:hypothetical protein